MNQYPVPDESVGHQLDLLARAALVVDEPLELRLYVNDLYPQRSTVLADYTEASFGGYSRRVIDRADWDVATVDDEHKARVQLSAGPETWTPTGGVETVYGCILVAPDVGKVRYARRFTTPRVLEVGVPLAVMPVITLASVVYS